VFKSEELLKHKNTIHVWYNCDQCHNKFDSPANLSIHMQVEHTIEDIIQTGVGFMMRHNSTAQTEPEPQLQPLPEPQLKPVSKSQHQLEPVYNQTNKKPRKSHKEHLKAKVKVKTLSKKAMQNSWKNKLLIAKKKVATLQEEHSGQPDFVIMIKNNVQEAGVTNASSTAGKYLVMAEGPLREKLLGPVVQFVKEDSYMFANSWNMDKEVMKNSSEEDEEEEEEEK
jgi:hypothetical protein